MLTKNFLIISLITVIMIVIGLGNYSVFTKTTPKKYSENPTPREQVQEDIHLQQKIDQNKARQTTLPPTIKNLNLDDFARCINNGGEYIELDFNAPKRCLLDNRIYRSNCVINDKYFVVEKALIDSVGSDILVKYKSTNNQKYPCEYIVTDSDFEIKNEWAEYVLALENDHLILDSGTGPDPRGLIIYNLISQEKVFTDSYSWPVTINNNTMTYWNPTNTEPNEINCPKIEEWRLAGLGAIVEAKVTLALLTLNKTELGEYRCSIAQ